MFPYRSSDLFLYSFLRWVLRFTLRTHFVRRWVRLPLRVCLISVVWGVTCLMSTAFAQETATLPYQTLAVPVPPEVVGQIEVLEFFAYSCGHCKEMKPMVQQWVKTLPKQVVFKSVPVAFSAAMKPLQQLYYTLEVLHRPDLHAKVFEAIHVENKPIFDRDSIREWVVEQGIDPAQFDAIFDSFSVQAEVERAKQLTDAYQIDGTPSYAVGEKYVTSPAIAGNSYQGVLDEMDKLIRLAQ